MIKKYINKIIQKFIEDNPKLIVDVLDKYIEKEEKNEAAYQLGLSILNEAEEKKTEVSFKCDYYEKVKKNKRYFAQRIEKGKINNTAPNWAKYVVSVTLEQNKDKKYYIDYSDVDKPVPERARIHQDVCGPSLKNLNSNIEHFVNYKKFFEYDVGREDAIESILARIKMKDRK